MGRERSGGCSSQQVDLQQHPFVPQLVAFLSLSCPSFGNFTCPSGCSQFSSAWARARLRILVESHRVRHSRILLVESWKYLASRYTPAMWNIVGFARVWNFFMKNVREDTVHKGETAVRDSTSLLIVRSCFWKRSGCRIMARCRGISKVMYLNIKTIHYWTFARGMFVRILCVQCLKKRTTLRDTIVRQIQILEEKWIVTENDTFCLWRATF